MIDQLAVNDNVLRVAAATVVITLLGTIVRVVGVRRADPQVAAARMASLKSWWGVILLTLCAAVLGLRFAVVLFAATSAAAMHEMIRLLGPPALSRYVTLACYGLIVASYSLVALRLPEWTIAFLPVAALGLASGSMLLTSTTEGFSHAMARTYYAVMLTGYAPAFAALVFTLPPDANPVAGNAGWFLFLMLVLEAGDIAQALVGRAIGKRRIAPIVSPRKTWAGFVAGVVVSIALAVVLGRWLTPWNPLVAMAAGGLICLAGFMGDLNISGIKRAAGARDSGTLLPGQGGVLDRIDSLTFAAPAYYWFVVLWHAASAAAKV